MDTLQIAYKILYSLEHKEKAEYMGALVGPEKLGAPKGKWLDVIRLMMEERYIAGVAIQRDIVGGWLVDIKNIHITLKGAEYLRDNSAMRKFSRISTDVISIIKP